MKSSSRQALVVALSVATMMGTSLGVATPVSADGTVTTVLTGLTSPRGIVFDGRHNLYVAESGAALPGAPGISHTGKVSKYRWHSTTPSWSTSFESLHAVEDPSAPPDALGPEGLSALSTGCSSGHRRACDVRVILSAGHEALEAASGDTIHTQQLGNLYRLDRGSGRPVKLSNVGDQSWAWTSAHKDVFSDFPDANPYAVLITRSHDQVRTFVADAAANTINEVRSNGSLRLISYIPNETAAPFRDATPTCIAQGPDGMLYVATLNLVANLSIGPGKSNVWRVDPNASYPTPPTLWATGLTTATACTFDGEGNFWAAEMFAPTSGAPGDLVRIPFSDPDHLTRVGGGDIPMPGGIAVGPDDALYVTTNAANPVAGSGTVVRVDN